MVNDQLVEAGGIAIQLVGLGRAEWEHQRDITQAKKHHEEAVNQAKEIHQNEIQTEKRIYLMETFTDIEQHFQVGIIGRMWISIYVDE